MADLNQRRGRRKRRAAPDSDSENNNKETLEKCNELVMEFNTDEPTMEEKLATLDFAIPQNKALTSSFANPLPSADSVHVLIRQALHADDHSLLMDCVYTTDDKVIAKSVSFLTPADVIKLINFFRLIIQSGGAIVACVIPWLRSLIFLKASSLVFHDSSLSHLNSLYQLIESRVSALSSAQKLSTSIDYHFSGIDDLETEDEVAPVIYEDKDSDEEVASDESEVLSEGESLESTLMLPGTPMKARL